MSELPSRERVAELGCTAKSPEEAEDIEAILNAYRIGLREELIQVAAVAVSIIEDLDYGVADSSVMQPFPGPGGSAFQGQSRFIVNEILEERRRQDTKWGPVHHPIDHWLTILMEEVGEAAKAAIGDTNAGVPK